MGLAEAGVNSEFHRLGLLNADVVVFWSGER